MISGPCGDGSPPVPPIAALQLNSIPPQGLDGRKPARPVPLAVPSAFTMPCSSYFMPKPPSLYSHSKSNGCPASIGAPGVPVQITGCVNIPSKQYDVASKLCMTPFASISKLKFAFVYAVLVPI